MYWASLLGITGWQTVSVSLVDEAEQERLRLEEEQREKQKLEEEEKVNKL